ncbi:MAG TPA: hypothetical protein PKN50_15120 [Spirochaetota bacterium]|nr:hypothetical protein [Spirochaetota bacterium]
MLKKLITGIVLPALCAAAVVSCSFGSGNGNPCLDLSGRWKLVEGGSMAAADPAYDDSAADEVTVPGSWGSILAKNENLTATVWLRKKVTIGREFSDRMLVLSLGSIALADEVYVNGVFVGSTGDFPPEDRPLDYTFSLHKERDSLAQALMKKSKQLQRAKKDLARTDVKPEPRDIIHDLIEYLDNNFNETYDRVTLAERFGLNEDYMGQLFKKVTNTNIAN